MMDLLRAAYDPQAPLPSDSDAYRRAIEDIEYFGVSPQVYSVMKRKGLLNRMPEPFREQLERDRKEALYPLLLIKQQTEQLLDHFDRAGLAAIPLKGCRFADKVFGHFGARTTSDIDLLVKETDLARAAACVKQLGYFIEEEKIKAHFHWSFSKPLPGSPVPLTVELHWDLLKAGSSALRIDDLWNAAQPSEPYVHIKELSELHTFYMICLHGWRHQLNSPKYVLDIVQMLEMQDERWELPDLLRLARSHRTLKRVVHTLRIVSQQFPHLDLERKLRLQATRHTVLWDYEALRDPNRRTWRPYLQFLSFQFFHFDSVFHMANAMWSWLLPSRLEAAFELGSDGERSPLLICYLKLYGKRCRGLWRAFRTVRQNN